MPTLTVKNIFKHFPSSTAPKQVLRDVSFEVPEGSIVCLLGPNGSGKTTLLKTISTLLSPDKGQILLGDLDAHRHPAPAKRLMGFASTEGHSFYGRLTVRNNLLFYSQLHGLTNAQWDRRLGELSAQLSLSDILDRPFRELSNGQKQKALIARAVLHDPPVLLLDEPNQNLDPLSYINLRTLMLEEWGKRQKKTILVSTHQLDDAQKLSDRWVVIAAGQVKFNGSLEQERNKGANFSAESFFQNLTKDAMPC